MSELDFSMELLNNVIDTTVARAELDQLRATIAAQAEAIAQAKRDLLRSAGWDYDARRDVMQWRDPFSLASWYTEADAEEVQRARNEAIA